MVMTVFMCTVEVYGNLYIFQLMKGEVLAAAALLPYAGLLLGGLVAIMLHMSTTNVIAISEETGMGGGRRGSKGEREGERGGEKEIEERRGGRERGERERGRERERGE